jgi:hypothetical protein
MNLTLTTSGPAYALLLHRISGASGGLDGLIYGTPLRFTEGKLATI